MWTRLLPILLLLCCVPALTQNDIVSVKYDDTRLQRITIDEDDLSTYRSDEKFDYTLEKTENTWLSGIKNWLYNLLHRFFEWIFGVEKATGFLSLFLRILPYILLVILIYLMVRFFVKSQVSPFLDSKKNPNTVILTEEERIIKSENIQDLIKEALANKNYRLAIRYYYLYILKLLSNKELIDWQLQKTNDDYLHELSNGSLKKAFAKATFLYDYVWYGEFQLDESKYQQAERTFKALQNSIESHG
ncbi:DUF4129 domain-containing protein [Flagellimonas lutaonensis]|uniref:Protein-glutamine gamma-glutamyltransferase-like C-terminal domain-containing protein n=1 Tax=Flagellimonas lutaonensis TaxID=516051 RepID=A0A0D5YQD3_9FLAO|nr:DUF4129 domain-containing protein [Allomuricauda lutaonensis]AKA34041.1 hypothetical protein VC82_359 [Allomuricauda lutaonensis]